jgi:hypothetical protein
MTFNLSLVKHHATLLVHPKRKEATSIVWEELEAASIANRLFDATVLDIDTARQIISWSKTPYHESRIALISFHTAGIPAQNALLKLLEEPQAGVRFILITSNRSALIETVISRVDIQDISSLNQEEAPEQSPAKIFLKTPYTERMKLPYITELLSRVDEEDRKDREAVRMFILSLIPLLTETQRESRYILETLEIASYASDPSSSGKTLLEYLSLLLPVID